MQVESTDTENQVMEIHEMLRQHIIASKSSSVEIVAESVSLENGAWVNTTNHCTKFERVAVDTNKINVLGYIDLAKSSTSLYMPDDVIPVVSVEGENIVVTFWDYKSVNGLDSRD